MTGSGPPLVPPLQVVSVCGDIFGQNIANPIAMIWSAAMMLDFLGERAAHHAIVGAIEQVLRDGPCTRDLGGSADTTAVGRAIADRVLAA